MILWGIGLWPGNVNTNFRIRKVKKKSSMRKKSEEGRELREEEVVNSDIRVDEVMNDR